MRRAHPGEVGGLISTAARRAYQDLVGDADPAAAAIAAGAIDLRPGGPDGHDDGPCVVSGPADLVELRSVVESITGPGTWLAPHAPAGKRLRATLVLERPAPALALIAAMEGLIDDRTGMWRTWRTVVELVAAGLADVKSLTLEAVVVTDPTVLVG